MTANTAVFSDNFITSRHLLDLNAMWDTICKVMLLSADEIFRKKWFKSFDSVFTKESSRFHKLKLLVLKIAKAFYEENGNRFAFLMRCWDSLDNVKALIVQEIVDSGVGFDHVCSALFSVQKTYHASKLAESLLNSYFVAKTGHLESQARLTSFLTAGAFVDDTIWIGSSQAATQHILDVTSKFFQINNISINNNKTVAISINCRAMCPNLFISGLSIFIVKRRESHHYLGIFLLTEGLLKPSLAKANTDVGFFANLVLRKTISDKQFLYLVLAVFQPIVNYRTQFSFVPISMCHKWDFLIHRGLKLKSSLSLDFPNDALYHPSLYDLKTFEQVQAENKVASVVCFANSLGILGQLFLHRSRFVLKSTPPVGVSSFKLSVDFLNSVASFSACFSSVNTAEPLDILESSEFELIYDQLLGLKTDCFSGLESIDMRAGAAVFFENISLGLRIRISGLMFSTLAELQAIALAVECVSPNSLVSVFMDSQAVLDVCKSELGLVYPDFQNCCWLAQIKGHSSVMGNKHADILVDAASFSLWCLIPHVKKCYILAEDLHMAAGFTSKSMAALCKRFVFKEWLREAISVFEDAKLAGQKVVKFVHNLCLAFKDEVWLICAKH
ncbi:hypothetical protein G9A89_000399 [Geosiphon pyriformis]|nr:hypothetical protein G9A89_000399 [Geosiphon pyriformis]